jgi:DNA-3-methyladenine glycosylase I
MSDPSPGTEAGPDGLERCWWCLGAHEYLEYHDLEWGRPLREDRALFEVLTLEAFQSGLSWLTILRKRAAFRAAFDAFVNDHLVGCAFRDAPGTESARS